MKKLGFTLSELMVALGILGIIAAITLPRINGSMPSRNKMMMKKAYYTIQDVVSDLINDERVYPSLDKNGKEYLGFDNTVNVCGEKPEGSTEGTLNGSEITDDSCQDLYKFPKLFAKKLNIDGAMYDIGDANITASSEENSSDENSFENSDAYKKFNYILGANIDYSNKFAYFVNRIPLYGNFVNVPLLVKDTYTAFNDRKVDETLISLVVNHNGFNRTVDTTTTGQHSGDKVPTDTDGNTYDEIAEKMKEQQGSDSSGASIRDLDIAADMLLYTKSTILAQAAASAPKTGAIVFNTTDGMTWLLESSMMNVESKYILANVITVDVNGRKGPNCYQGSNSTACSTRTKDFDQFVVVVIPNGKIIPFEGQTWFEDAIGIDSSLSN